ncbi:hypothetical protein KGO95_03830 [Patescibacteria group bacterium]|nr:hypothetical protein [Patescibacteria group bacterium]
MSSIFKAYDVRGVYPDELNEQNTVQISRALARYFGRGAMIVIGHDARLSSPSLYKAVKKSLTVKGHLSHVIDAGLMTTPMLYFLVNDLKADGGIMVTASHNPKEYNGLKIVKKGARPISGMQVESIMKKYKHV